MIYHINTINTQKEQLQHGSFKFGNGPEIMLFIGSCRTIPYLNYLSYLDAGKRFTIHFIDPFNYHWDVNGKMVDFEANILSLETNKTLLDLFASAKWYVHELYGSFGMFNSFRFHPKNIYAFGLKPEVDITLPNFHDIFVLFQDFAVFNPHFKSLFSEDIKARGRLSEGVIREAKTEGLDNLEKFYGACQMSDMPEMEAVFKQNWQRVRFFWNSNHVAMSFTKVIFKLLNDRFLKLETSTGFWKRVESEDMYANPHTAMTNYDMEAYGLQWNEPVAQLKL